MPVRPFVVTIGIALAACGGGDVVGPYSGPTRRFSIDQIQLPTSASASRAIAIDLDDDGVADNALGGAIGSLMSYGDAQTHVAELIASGALASVIEIQADDLETDDSVGVTFYGREGAPARVMGGQLAAGAFTSNPIATAEGEHTGQAVLVLPVLGDADPIELAAVTLQVSLAPDGRGGYDAWIAGGVRSADALVAARDSIERQLAAHPEDHRSMWILVDRNYDGVVSLPEVKDSLIGALLAPDVQLDIDGATEAVLSFAFQLHATPCTEGTCPRAAPVQRCFDRVRDGDEADVDCGGSCGIACAGGAACRTGADCQSAACDAGTCRAISCDDGVKNGLEAALDCGGACARKCTAGAICGFDLDCASNQCSATTSTGVCQ